MADARTFAELGFTMSPSGPCREEGDGFAGGRGEVLAAEMGLNALGARGVSSVRG